MTNDERAEHARKEYIDAIVETIRTRKTYKPSVTDIRDTIGRSYSSVRQFLIKHSDLINKAIEMHDKIYGKLSSEAEISTSASRSARSDVNDPILRADIVRALRRGWISLDTLASKLACDRTIVSSIVQHLQASGYMVQFDGPRLKLASEPKSGAVSVVDKAAFTEQGVYTFGVISDTHLCNDHERLDVLNDAYDQFAKRGIRDVYHIGNIIDGEAKFNQYELKRHGIFDQTMYVINMYPKKPGITTHYISADCHEGWYHRAIGIDWGEYLQLQAQKYGRDDLHYLGYIEADIELRCTHGKSVMRLFHPGGGTAYALSYQPQKIVESLSGGEKPSLLIVGHYHKLGYFMVRNVHVVLAGCAEDQTFYMRKKHIEAHVGYWIITVQQDKKGAVRRVIPEVTNYYDRNYHISGVVDIP